MCGIGIKYKDNYFNTDKLRHRGIESWVKRSGEFLMYHNRLPLQTVIGDGFKQPIDLGEDRFLLYNGEIFNYPKQFDNDVEYLISIFSKKQWMRDLYSKIDKWDGFWAIAIVDESGYFAFTDPLGKKQLYFKDGCLSSEIKPLLEPFYSLNENYDREKVKSGHETPFSKVTRLLPNMMYRVGGHSLFTFNPDPMVDLKRKPYDRAGLKEILAESVRIRTVNRLDQNSIFVSGGLDSTIILSHFKAPGLLDNLDLLTIDNGEDNQYIEIIENWLNKEVRRIKLPETWRNREAVYRYEHPLDLGSLFQQFHLCSAAKGSVIYTGDGADELFSGYSRAQKLDTQEFDIFVELPYYHNIRLDRMGMTFTKEIRSPFMSHDLVRFAWNTPWTKRFGKQQLKDAYWNDIPREIIERRKTPLRNDDMRISKTEYKTKFNTMFNQIFAQ